MLENKLCYEDEYMYFAFGENYSKNFNLFIQTEEDELKMILDSDANVEFSSPKNQSKNYVLGVSRPRRVIPLKMVAYGVTREELRSLFQWLKVGQIGELSFDFASDWCYDAVVEKISNPILTEYEQLIVNGEIINTFIASFDITFSTINNVFARLRYPDQVMSTDEIMTSNNNMLLPTVISNGDSQYHILFLGNESVSVDFECDCAVGEAEQNVLPTTIKVSFSESAETETVFTFTPQITSAHVAYKSNSHIIFVNNKLIPQAEYEGDIIVNTVSMGLSPLKLFSPGAPVKIQSQEHYQQLVNNAVSDKYKICKYMRDPNTEDALYAEFLNEQSPYPFAISGSSDVEIDDCVGAYFVYYATLQFEGGSNKTITINNYTEAL